MGSSGGLSHDVAEKIANYNTFFSEQDADILTLQEYTQYIDSNQQYASETAIFDNHFDYSSYTENELIIQSKYNFTNSAFSYLHTSGDHPSKCVYGTTTINGISFTLVTAVLHYQASLEEKLRALNKLVNVILPSSGNVIIGMDTNVVSKEEADELKSYLADNGINSANWTEFGYLETYNLNWSGYRCIDNIFFRGNIEIDGFTVPYDVYSDLSSDHYPVIANLSICS